MSGEVNAARVFALGEPDLPRKSIYYWFLVGSIISVTYEHFPPCAVSLFSLVVLCFISYSIGLNQVVSI